MCWKLQILKTPVKSRVSRHFQEWCQIPLWEVHRRKSIERYDTIPTLTRNDTYPVGNIKADKEKSAEKIDGTIATIIGLDCTIYCGNDTDASVYNGRIIYLFYVCFPFNCR